MGVIFYLSSKPATALPTFPDYLSHLGEYFVLGLLVALSFNSSGLVPEKTALFAVLWSTFYGITDEFHQFFVPTRTPSLKDIAMDTLGGIIAVLLWLFIKKQSAKGKERSF